MHLAFSSNAFVNVPLESAIREIAEAGYEGIEILCDRPHAVPGTLTPDDRARIAAEVRAAGLRISNLNSFPTWYMGDTYRPTWIDDGEAEKRIEHTRGAMELAAGWGVPHVSTSPGGPLPDGMAREEALERYRRGLESLYPDSRRTGVKILIEPEPTLLIERSSEFLEFIPTLDPECVGLNFDVGHFFSVGEDPAALVPLLKEWTAHYHLEDIHENRFHHHLIPGRGAIDIEGVLKAIDATGYDGWVTVEVYPRADAPGEAAREAMRHLETLDVGL
jgi:sugar phosphate isomerase/epimerase